jgi:hypothetical protein
MCLVKDQQRQVEVELRDARTPDVGHLGGYGRAALDPQRGRAMGGACVYVGGRMRRSRAVASPEMLAWSKP